MLAEFKGVAQERGGRTRRRWFQDDGMELIVWYRPDGAAEGFQICYRGSDLREHALTWRDGTGFSHARVDPGDSRPDKNLTPILVAGEPVPWERVIAGFTERAGALDAGVRELVLGALAGRNG